MPIWNKRYECISRDELEQIQLERLQSTLNRVYLNVKFYRRMFKELGLVPDDIRSLEDLAKLPFTTKADLKEAYPYDMFALPLREVVRIHATSGTTGEPIVVGYTKNDLRNWSELNARILTAGGITEDDVIQIAFGYGLFTGGFGFHYGAERIGATVIPASTGNTRRQIQIMQSYQTTALVCTPSYALHLAEVMDEMGVNPKGLLLRKGLFGAEPWSEEMRREIEHRLSISATDNYGLTEIIGPGVSGECQEKKGMHIQEDHFIPEVIDPRTGERLPPGEPGELVFTTITKEAFPLIRYRTGDITSLDPNPCPCGRTQTRMAKVSGRTDDMIIVRGVKFFPSQVENVLMQIEGTEPHYQIVIAREGVMDSLEVMVEVSESIFTDEMGQLRALEEKIRNELRSTLGVEAKVSLVEPRTLARSAEGDKIKRVIDRRTIK
ncbi:MAG: phenylacetate--CoA ligase family protein [bacterium]